jgi:hypothetical protein
MAVKLIMTWDIQSGKEQEYFEFIGRSFMPAVIEMGLDMREAWLTIYGEHPQILVSAIFPSRKAAERVIDSENWQLMNESLMEYVDDYEEKIVPIKGAFQF